MIRRAVAPESSCLWVTGSVSGLGLVFPLGRRLFRRCYSLFTGLAVLLLTFFTALESCCL